MRSKDKVFDKFELSRRGLLKSMAAVAATATLAGCGGSSSDSTPADTSDEINYGTESVVTGCTPHNCGGACVQKAYVSNGVLRRVLTDDRPDKNWVDAIQGGTAGDNPQQRTCVRCHSQKSWLYNSNRLLYPLIQTGDRGNLSTFKRISWDEALTYIKDKVEKVRRKYGPGAFFNMYASAVPNDGQNFTVYSGGTPVTYIQDYSFPSLDYTAKFTIGAGYIPIANSRQDIKNAELAIIWSHNLSETFWGTNSMWYLTQFKELGKAAHSSTALRRVVVVDQRISRTAGTIVDNMANDYFAPVHGTDSAMVLAMIHSMLTDHIGDLMARHGVTNIQTPPSNANWAELKEKIGKYVYGFFDSGTDTTKDSTKSNRIANMADADFKAAFGVATATAADRASAQATFQTKYKVPDGASLSAYIMGTNSALVTAGVNAKISIYPENINYNKWTQTPSAYVAQNQNKCYGQTEKTPAWAEAITGVPAARIKTLAKDMLTKKTTVWLGGGLQRNSESEQIIMLMMVLMGLTMNFGAPGQAVGWYQSKGAWSGAAGTWSSGVTADDFKDFTTEAQNYGVDPATKDVDYKAKMYKANKLTFPGLTYSFGPGSIPAFTWLDAVEATNSAKVTDVDGTTQVYPSKWNHGGVKRLPAPMKVLFNCGGNILINQNGNTKYAREVLTSLDSANEFDSKYKIKLIVSVDGVMAPSCQYSDIILPAALGLEKVNDIDNFWAMGAGFTNSHYKYGGKAIEPPGEALNELEIGARFAQKFGVLDKFYNGKKTLIEGKNGMLIDDEAIIKDRFGAPRPLPGGGTMSFDEWKHVGVYDNSDINTALDVWGTGFRTDPATNFLPTPSGRIEAYVLGMMEDYEARSNYNIDSAIALPNGGEIKTASFASDAARYSDATKGRFVYPVAMYIPLAEGRHADGTHPDPFNLNSSYPKSLHTWHMMYRSHSTFNSSPLLNDFYKFDKDGKFASIKRGVTNANSDGATIGAQNAAPMVWTDNVYEAVWVNPATTYDGGGTIKNGDVAYVENARGKIKVSVQLTNCVRKDVIMIGQGSWTSIDSSGVDIGGCANTLTCLRPSRVGFGMSLANDCRVKITKA